MAEQYPDLAEREYAARVPRQLGRAGGAARRMALPHTDHLVVCAAPQLRMNTVKDGSPIFRSRPHARRYRCA